METIRMLADATRYGVLPAMATPLLPDGATINADAVWELVDFLVERGVRGLFVGGTTGEGMVLTTAERKWLHQQAMEAARDRVPILLHVGSNRLWEALELADHAGGLAPAGIVALTPIFYNIDDDAILSHFQAIAGLNPEIPFFAYDMPHLSINGVSPGLLRRMQDTIPNFGGLKCSRHDAQAIRALIHASREEDLFLVGNERIALGTLAMGATGMISGLATAIPEPFVALGRAVAAGDLAEARRQHGVISGLLDHVPAGQRIGFIKQIISERGIPAGPAVPPRTMPEGGPWWPRLAPLVEG
jgi:dihydrodipicolinate synthase/N-acetylneuraminate lyase